MAAQDASRNTSLRSPLAKVRGLGSAKEGTHHFWMQRLTAIALLPLILWFCFSIAMLPNASFEEAHAWVASPLNAVLLILLLFIGFYHAMLGIQIVLEDYVSTEWLRMTCIVLVNFTCIFLAVSGVFLVLKLSLEVA